jgi:hypothetical protein
MIDRPHEAPHSLFPVFSVSENLLAEVLAPPSQHRSIVTVQPNGVCTR